MMAERSRFALVCALAAAAVAALWLLCPTRAQEPAEENAREQERQVPPELRRILDALDAANAEVEAVRTQVLYTREIPLLEDSQVSRGFIEFRKPDLLHLKLRKPRNEEIYCDGEHWWVVEHNEKQVEVYEAARSENVAAEASFLTFGYGQSSEKLLEEYEIELVETKQEPPDDEDTPITSYRLRFEPREEDAPARFAAIEVELADDLWLPRVIVLHESDGEIVHTFALHDIELDPELDEQDFTYKPPRGYAILEP